MATPDTDSFTSAVAKATDVAATHAADVDGAARFPREAIDVLRDAGALGALVPARLGGADVPFEQVADACATLGRACSSTAMVFAMHQIQVSVMARHGGGSAWYDDYLRTVAAEQRLIASATSEVGIGGDMGRSAAAVEPTEDGRCRFEKQAPTVSYGGEADDLFTTLRRHPEAEANDQVIVLTTAEQTTLTPTGTWNTLGMRGTCSPGFIASATFDADQVLPVPFAQVSAETMVPVSHLLWSHLWCGIAAEAFDRARAMVRSGAAKSGSAGVAGRRLSQASALLTRTRSDVASALEYFLRASAVDERPELSTMAAALRFNTLKITASEAAAEICHAALGITGFAGYKNDTPFSVGRQLRDSLSAAVMVANDRLHESNAALLLVVKDA
jgi:acyl-CoA dehydrogenase